MLNSNVTCRENENCYTRSNIHFPQMILHFFSQNVPFQLNFRLAFLSPSQKFRFEILVNMGPGHPWLSYKIYLLNCSNACLGAGGMLHLGVADCVGQ